MKDKALPDLHEIPDDGFAITTAEPWVKHKIELVRQYLNAFVSALAGQVDEVIFVDLYARNGLCCLGAKKDIFPGISLMALQQDLPISKYVLCEGDAEQFRILKIRTNKYFKEKNVVLLNGKPEELIDKIKMYVSEPRKNHKVATICVADAFGLEPGFETIRQLNDYDFTFLIPFTFHLGRKINHRFYMGREKEKLVRLLGEELESNLSEKTVSSNSVFYRQLIQNWERKVEELGMNTSVSTHKLDSGLMEMPTYSICLFAKKYSARAIQLDALAGSHIQFALFNQN
ncbi:MAG: three-Cys-motif partner protein TcmP [Cyclobacteriaceae bacterium]